MKKPLSATLQETQKFKVDEKKEITDRLTSKKQ
jgi:hypothetical protein